MNYQHLLEKDEQIEMVINPTKGLILHGNDIFKIIVFLFFISVSVVVGFVAGYFLLIAFGIVISIWVTITIIKRYQNTLSTYIITNQRILFVRENSIVKSLFIENLKNASYESIGKDRGYIILGEPEELFAGRGISFSDDAYILDNLNNYNETSNFIKNKIKTAHNTR